MTTILKPQLKKRTKLYMKNNFPLITMPVKVTLMDSVQVTACFKNIVY